MQPELRNEERDGNFIASGGLKNWGCYAVLLAALVLSLLFVLVRLILTQFVGETIALWVSLIVLIGIIVLCSYLWIRRRQRQRLQQEQVWQQAMRH